MCMEGSIDEVLADKVPEELGLSHDDGVDLVAWVEPVNFVPRLRWLLPFSAIALTYERRKNNALNSFFLNFHYHEWSPGPPLFLSLSLLSLSLSWSLWKPINAKTVITICFAPLFSMYVQRATKKTERKVTCKKNFEHVTGDRWKYLIFIVQSYESPGFNFKTLLRSKFYLLSTSTNVLRSSHQDNEF